MKSKLKSIGMCALKWSISISILMVGMFFIAVSAIWFAVNTDNQVLKILAFSYLIIGWIALFYFVGYRFVYKKFWHNPNEVNQGRPWKETFKTLFCSYPFWGMAIGFAVGGLIVKYCFASTDGINFLCAWIVIFGCVLLFDTPYIIYERRKLKRTLKIMLSPEDFKKIYPRDNG